MKTYLSLALLLIINTAFAQDNQFANKQANKQKLMETKSRSIGCYKTDHSANYKITKISKLKQLIESPEDSYEVILLNNNEIQLYKNKGYYGSIDISEVNLNFRNGNIDIQTITDELKDIQCYYGAETYFIHYNDTKDFIFHNHVQSRFYGYSESFIQWYFSFANGFKNYPNYILLDGPSQGSIYEISLTQLEANTGPYRDADLLTGYLEDNSYKIAPSGNIHLSFGEKFNGKIFVMGTAYNYCTTNLILSIGRALISSKRSFLEIKFPGYFNHYQKLGLTSSLNIDIETQFNDIKTLKETDPNEFKRIFKLQKELIEKELNYEVEILIKGLKSKTNKPKLILNIY